MRREKEFEFRTFVENKMQKVTNIDFENGIVTAGGKDYKIDEICLMQSTGIRTGHSVLYEGDIVSVAYDLFVIGLNKGRLQLVNLKDDTVLNVTDAFKGQYCGNIFENKKLLEFARDLHDDLQREAELLKTIQDDNQ